MSVSEKRVAKVIWRALERHIKAGHVLEVRRMPEDDELEINCCWCDSPVMAGSPVIVGDVVASLKESGVKINDLSRPVIDAF